MSVSVAVQLPGRKVISVPLNTDSTAADVIYQCKRSDNLSDEYFLTADFDGFDKLFEPEERLYHLVKKHVVASGREKDVQFFLRKKKATNKGKLLSDSVSSLSLDSQNEEMAVALRSTTSEYGELRALSTSQLRQIALQRKNTIEENYAKINEKNQKLHGLLKCSGIDIQLHKTIRQVKERLVVEEARYRQLAKLKGELANYTLCYQSLIHELEQVNSKIESKQFALEHCDRSIDELGRLLAKVKLQRMLLSKKAEISLLDNEIRELSPTVTQQHQAPPCPPSSSQEKLANKCAVVERPRAAVEPFKAEPESLIEKEEPALTDYVKSEGFQEAYSAVEEVLSSDLKDSSVPAEKCNSPEVNRDAADNAKLPNDIALINPYKVNVSINKRFQMASTKFDNTGHSPPPDLIPASEKTKFLCHSQTTDPSSTLTVVGDEMIDSMPVGNGEFVKVEPDRMYVRSDTLRAAKRRSWADHHIGNHSSTNDETEHIRLLLCRELKKGKTSVNLSWILDQLNGVGDIEASSCTDLKPFGENMTAEEDKDKSPCSDANPSEETSKAALDCGLSDGCPPAPLSSTVPAANCNGNVKGILMNGSKSGRSDVKKSVRFDPLALLLDAALEGELDLVKRCAKEVPNVSVCYEEGITALHNAICAGNYEVVRFLVEAGADVNAQDSDGWTPLHCAASCNNLPIVKFLVEHGACIFAATLSDQETPADKCEENEEGFIGCSQFLVNLQERMGVINSGRVYAGCNYDKQREDEISFKLDDELRVLSKETEEKNWWWVVHLATGQEGYVPRNLLALYPRLTRNCYLKCTFNDAETNASDSQ